MLQKKRHPPFPTMKSIADSMKLKVKRRLKNPALNATNGIKKHHSQKDTLRSFAAYFVIKDSDSGV
jgi:hypothetical protein